MITFINWQPNQKDCLWRSYIGNKLQLIVISNIVDNDKRIEKLQCCRYYRDGDNIYWNQVKNGCMLIRTEDINECEWEHEMGHNHTNYEVYAISWKLLFNSQRRNEQDAKGTL